MEGVQEVIWTLAAAIFLQEYRLMFFTCNIVFMSIGTLILSRLARAHCRVARISPQCCHSTNIWPSIFTKWKSPELLLPLDVSPSLLNPSQQAAEDSLAWFHAYSNYVPDVIRSPGNINKDLDKHNWPSCNKSRMNFCVNHSYIQLVLFCFHRNMFCLCFTILQRLAPTPIKHSKTS